MRILNIKEGVFIKAESYATKYSWGHTAKLYIASAIVCNKKVQYFNRTWEARQFDTVISILIDKIEKNKLLTSSEISKLRNKIQ